MATPSFEQLIAFAAQDLPADQAVEVAAFLRTDPQAAAVVRAYRAAHQLVASDDGVDPSAASIARAKAIFASRASQGAPAGGVAARWLATADRFVARLVYDSRLQPAAVRFSGNDDRINLAFDTGRGEVDLQAERSKVRGAQPRWHIMGRIAGIGEGRPHALGLVSRDQRAQAIETESDASGGFAFDAPPGDYELLIRREHDVVVLGPIQLT